MSGVASQEPQPDPIAGLVTSLFGLLADASQAIEHDPRAAAVHIKRARELLTPFHSEPAPASPNRVEGGLLPWQIIQVENEVARNLSQRLDPGRFARSVGLSVRQFSRAFGLSFGISPHAYVMAKRLAEAKRLMLGSDLALAEIASACGLSDQAHLCHLFRRTAGVSPAQWRRVNGWMKRGGNDQSPTRLDILRLQVA